MKIAIFNPYFESLGGGEKVTSVMADHLSKQHDVYVLVKQPVDVKRVEKYFDVNLGKVTFLQLPPDPFIIKLFTHRFVKLPGRWKSLLYDASGLRALKKLGADLFINNLYQSSLPSPAPKSIYMCMFPQKLDIETKEAGTVRRVYETITNQMERRFLGNRVQAIASYTVVTANSKYTAGWIKKYWNRTASVVYPVCDDMGPPAAKKPIILNVGRFFADNGSSHHKKQHDLIKAFIKLGRDDWELHLAGSAGSDEPTAEYLESLEELKAGHKNIVLHVNAPLDDLKNLYRTASIYWHATGLGYDGDEFPENQEHFGISTVEAMSAGVVPVVIKSAGQLEIINSGRDGLLWTTKEELVKLTSQLIGDKKRLGALSRAAVKSAAQFDRAAFVKRFDKIILEACHD